MLLTHFTTQYVNIWNIMYIPSKLASHLSDVSKMKSKFWNADIYLSQISTKNAKTKNCFIQKWDEVIRKLKIFSEMKDYTL